MDVYLPHKSMNEIPITQGDLKNHILPPIDAKFSELENKILVLGTACAHANDFYRLQEKYDKLHKDFQMLLGIMNIKGLLTEEEVKEYVDSYKLIDKMSLTQNVK